MSMWRLADASLRRALQIQ